MVFPATLRRMLIALNGYEGPEYYQAGDSSCKPGYVVMFDDADEVKICTSTGKPIGIVGCDADHDLMTVYAAGERMPVYPLGSGVDIYSYLKIIPLDLPCDIVGNIKDYTNEKLVELTA